MTTRGSIRVSFAGTFTEAVAFARRHPGLSAPKGLARRGDDDGLPMLCASYTSLGERHRKSALLAELGWAPEFQINQPHGRGF